ncbi:MAG TPA: PfkB family carbohydrate kinase, partial [Gammaproteobacteria bacterium]|nr:PfkB family carbohydrate kinase [Gammaproteobacteria bacterium]
MKAVFSPDSTASVLVVGDVILDRYVHGETSRISPEAPVPVVLVRQTEERPGGAGNVALNISCLGLQVHLIGLTGQDPAAEILERKLSQQSVICHFLQRKDFPTVTKLRVISQHQQLIRLDYESRDGMAGNGDMFGLFRQELDNARVVVLSDYAKGSLSRVQEYIAACKSADRKVLIDPKGSDFQRYRGAGLLTPNLKEFESIVGHCANQEDLVSRGQNLCNDLQL